jgi:hypothetical protein
VLPKVEEVSDEALPKCRAPPSFAKSLCTDGVASSTELDTTQETRTLISSSVRFDNQATLNRYKCVKHKYAGSYKLPVYTAITLRESQRSTRHAITRWYQTPVVQRGSSEAQASVYALPNFLAVVLVRGMTKASDTNVTMAAHNPCRNPMGWHAANKVILGSPLGISAKTPQSEASLIWDWD